MATLESLYEQLTDKPEDWALRNVLADWYEEQGQQAAADSLRWTVRRRKRPYHGSSSIFTWFNADAIGPGLGDPESDLPGALYKHLQGGTESAHHKSYKSLRAAEEAFQAAWSSARGGGWDPKG